MIRLSCPHRPPAPTNRSRAVRPAAPSPTLSLYLSCNLLETSFSASTIPTTLMFGIREPKEQVGKREGRDGWIWRVWENEWCFGAGSEYWGEKFSR